MYSVLPMQSSIVFEKVAASSSPSFNKTTPVPFNPIAGRYSTFIDKSIDLTASELQPSALQSIVVESPMMSANGRCDYVTASPRTVAAERSTPLKPAKRDRAADDDDRQILRCKRSLASSLNTAATSRLDGGSRQPQPSTSTFTASESVERRNLRERRRVKLINVTFATLRNRLPSYCWQQQQRQQPQQQRRDRRQRDGDGGGVAGNGSTKRPSKVDTLRTAINYIRCLQDLLADDDRQRVSTFQTFDAATTDTVVSGHHWATSPPAVGYDVYSPVTSVPSSPSEDVTTSATVTATLTSTFQNNNPDFTDETYDREVTLSPLPDILDWLI